MGQRDFRVRAQVSIWKIKIVESGCSERGRSLGKRRNYKCGPCRVLGDWLRSLGSTQLVPRSLQTSISMHHPIPREKTFTYPGPPHSGHTLLHFQPSLFLSTCQMLLLDPWLGDKSLGASLGATWINNSASAHREPGGFSQDLRRHQADHQQTLGHGSPSKETAEGWA